MNFIQILKKSQAELKSALESNFRFYGYNVTNGNGYLYKDGTFPVLLVAHMDTVHKEKPWHIIKDGSVWSSPQGIGGDDRCGIYMILKIIEKYDCAVLFTEDEEIGCIGASKFATSDLCKSLKGKFNYIIELDRHGKNDAVFYECANDDFEAFITERYWETKQGSYSDICEIAPALGVAAVNLSCGYHSEHQITETVNVAEMNHNIKEVCNLLSRTKDTVYEYVSFCNSYWWDGQTEYEIIYNNYYEVEYILADSEAEAVGIFCMNHPQVSYSEINSVKDDMLFW